MDDHSHEHEHGATGHSHNLDPSVFETSAATDEPIGYIMALHITFMVLCMSLGTSRFIDYELTYNSFWILIPFRYGAWLGKKPMACTSPDTGNSIVCSGILLGSCPCWS